MEKPGRRALFLALPLPRPVAQTKPLLVVAHPGLQPAFCRLIAPEHLPRFAHLRLPNSRPLGGAFDIYELLPAFIISAICIVVVSLCTPAPEQEIVEEFESLA